MTELGTNNTAKPQKLPDSATESPSKKSVFGFQTRNSLSLFIFDPLFK
jgi:hypothetical protein